MTSRQPHTPLGVHGNVAATRTTFVRLRGPQGTLDYRNSTFTVFAVTEMQPSTR